MYHKEKSIQIKSSASALYNNLSVLPIAERSLTYFTVVHGNVVNMVSASGDGLNFSHRQLQSKEGSIAASSSLIIQASWCVLPSRVLLVLTSQKGIQMYESDGSIMVYWHALDIPETPTAQAVFARGIAAARGNYICVGTSCGSVLVFDVPSKGSNITLSEVLEEHREPITDIASESSRNEDGMADLVTADDSGLLCVWKSGEDFSLVNKIPAYGLYSVVSAPEMPHTSPAHSTCKSIKRKSGKYSFHGTAVAVVLVWQENQQRQLKHCPAGMLSCQDASTGGQQWNSQNMISLSTPAKTFTARCSCSSVKLWCGVVVAGYGSGQIRLYDGVSGSVYAEVNAHARWIYALDVAPDTGTLLSGAEDSLVRIWKFSRTPETDRIEIEHRHTECVTDVQICGAKFCDSEGNAFAVTGYDLSEIIRYTLV
ncbi:WDR54 protein, partial [Atractosteus spatula]|nr:WDR54 protein [Atractosteus spatula]